MNRYSQSETDATYLGTFSLEEFITIAILGTHVVVKKDV